MGIIIKSISQTLEYVWSDNEFIGIVPPSEFTVNFIIVTATDKVESEYTIRDKDDLSFKEAKEIITKQIKDSL